MLGTADTDVDLSKPELERYARHVSLRGFGPKGQERLCKGRVLIVGAGGLGCPCALYLIASGVGIVGIADADTVSLDNLHRQIGHTEGRVGAHKTSSLQATASSINSLPDIRTHNDGITKSNALALCQEYDIVADCSDNPYTRYLVNDACILAGVPLVSAAAVGTDGQLSVYGHKDGPCYRCIYPECPAPAHCTRCADAGVLGPVPGVMGTLQALECIKLLAGVGEPLSQRLNSHNLRESLRFQRPCSAPSLHDRAARPHVAIHDVIVLGTSLPYLQTLLLYDALTTRFTRVRLRPRRPDCAACSPGAQLRRTEGGPADYDYASFTGGHAPVEGGVPESAAGAEAGRGRITAAALAERLARGPSSPPAAPGAAAGQAGDDEGRAAATQGGGPVQGGPVQPGVVMLDVRPRELYEACRIRGAVHVGMREVEARVPDVLALQQQCGQGAVVVVMCRRGNDSMLAAAELRRLGVAEVVDLVGGLHAWADTVDAGMPKL